MILLGVAFSFKQSKDYGSAFIFIGSALGILVVCHFVEKRERQTKQRIRNTTLPARYCLFLRPFESEELSVDWYATGAALPGTQVLSIDEWIARPIYPIPLQAIGGNTIGAGKMLVEDEEWRREAIQQIKDALAIFLLPSLNPGTLWEIGQIVRHRRSETTIVVCPPTDPKTQQGMLFAKRWEQSRLHLKKELGFDIPAFNSKGFLHLLVPRPDPALAKYNTVSKFIAALAAGKISSMER